MTFAIIAVVAWLIVATFHFLFMRLLNVRNSITTSAELLESPFSPERYLAMDRLLDHLDEEFLVCHASCNRQTRKRFRQRRVAIFRGYLKMLSGDFSRICRTIKLHAIGADVDRSQLAVFVLKEQLRFARNMASVEFKLAMYSLGWGGVDAHALIAPLNTMRDRLQVLAAIPEPMGA